MVSKKEILYLKLQKFIDNLLFIITGYLVLFILKYIGRYKIPNIEEIRKFYREICNQNEPILICPNHLTLIDSAILLWALANNFYYLFHFSKFAWNIPAKENVENSLFFRIIVYLTKCILIDREGSKEHKEKILQKLIYLLKNKESVMIFPEGTRSPTGKIYQENIQYGAGQLVAEVPNTKVLVIYARAKTQMQKSDYPPKGDEIFIRYKLIQPEIKGKGLRLYRNITVQIMNELFQFENEFFSSY